MTLKARLAGMMALVLVTVVAVQFVLAERERRDLVSRLEKMSGDLDRSTAVFVQRAHEMAAQTAPPRLDSFLAGIVRDSAGTLAASNANVQVVVIADSMPHAGRGRRTEQIVWMRRGGVMAVVESTLVDSIFNARVPPVEQHFTRVFRKPAGSTGADQGPGRDFIINLPLPNVASDSLYSVQVRYSYAGLAEELSHSRRRSLFWLVALLGLGVVAAIGIAGQFTRPIRALEVSFGRVVEGDLDQRVRPERRDEIGHLTTSFNTMVARLRDSQQMAERLAESEHLASLGRLAAGIAHEIRNPLNAILLNLQQMQDRVRTASPAPADAVPAPVLLEFEKYHGRITTELARLEHLVGSFLDLAKSGELHFDRVDIAAGVRTAVELFRPLAADRGVDLQHRGPESLLLWADPTRMPMVWNNLLANALQATPRGGRVTIHTRLDGDAAEVVVEDSGAGIQAELLPRIWEPFYSGREDGTGLGLSIVRSTVEHHGGSIEAECPPSGGTRMRVRLPLQGPGAGTGPIPPGPPEAA